MTSADEEAQSGIQSRQISTEVMDTNEGQALSVDSRPVQEGERKRTTDSATEESSIDKPPQSQPMTASSSSSSDKMPKGTNSTAKNGASPYGTRSRNRTGAQRPNYAEDKEVEMDYEYTAPKISNGIVGNKAAASEASNGDVQAGHSGRSSGVNTRRASAAANGATTSTSTSTTAAKEQIPGTLTFSANPSASVAPPNSKKRKATGAGSSAGTQGAGTNQTVGGQTSTRRSTNAVTTSSSYRETNIPSFDNCQRYLKNGKLKADDGTTFSVNDNAYLICEPPGEPYYLARIMEFLHVDNMPEAPIDALRVNWFYRPRDIQRKVTDTRLVFATMHSDTCPLTSLRGKCQILHKSEIPDLDTYRKTKDCFWYEKMFDRYIEKPYEIIPVKQIINVPAKVKKALDERWKFVIVEIGRGKELTSAVKSCKRCAGYCASNDSVECAVCHNTYHMNCVRPPLQKKPSRGFGWSCGPCSRAQERKLEARNTPLIGEALNDAEEEEYFDEDEDEPPGRLTSTGDNTPAQLEHHDHPATAEQIAQTKLWPYRYLGIHCRVEDALDYDDRIYPRASSRLGPRHQANVNIWHGRPVEYVKASEIKRRYGKGGASKKDGKLSKETMAAIEAEKTAREKRPKWVMDEPPGYIHRGEDKTNDDQSCTAKLLWRMPTIEEISSTRGEEMDSGDLPKTDQREKLVDNYMTRARGLAKDVGVKDYSTNFLDKALELLYKNNYAVEEALRQLKMINKRKDLKEPELNREELKRFEEGVGKYGSELHSVTKHVKTVKEADIVRFYYMWKKTDRGRQIWGNYEGRKGKKALKMSEANASKLADDVADDQDDSAFDNDKAAERKRGFECKFCSSRKSRQWRRAPGIAPGTTIPADPNAKGSKDKNNQLVVALCHRCAGLWRKYAIQWENIDEVAKKVAQGGGRAWKRRIDEELLTELVAANEAASAGTNSMTSGATAPSSNSSVTQTGQEPAKKKLKAATEKESRSTPASDSAHVTTANGTKKKATEQPAAPPPKPEIPKPKILPCAICEQMEPMGDQHLACRECRMTVHRSCYGVGEVRNPNKWVCDMCSNDKNPQVSTLYECVLCPVRFTEHDFVEPPKVSHKKKTDKDREKERLERELAVEAAQFYRRKQEELNRPLDPREPLKRTVGNNWVHVSCAIWTQETKFGNAKALEPCEGIGTIPSARYEQICKICKTNDGACVSCHQCHAPFHVGCAQQAGYTMGFDVTPVKGSRRDLVNTVTLGKESGSMTALIWCKDHAIKSIVHPMSEVVDDSGINALQLFVQLYKQADLGLTGTSRKANLLNQSTKLPTTTSAASAGNRRASTTNGTLPVGRKGSRSSPAGSSPRTELSSVPREAEDSSESGTSKKKCITCGIDVSPKWWRLEVKLPKSSTLVQTSRPSLQPSPTLEEPPQDGVLNETCTTKDMSPKMSDGQSSQIPVTNGRREELFNDGIEDVSAATAAAPSTNTPIQSKPSSAGPVAVQCHKCHWNKLREPPPPKAAPPVPPSTQQVPPQPINLSHPPPPAQLPWPPAPPGPSQPPYHGWGTAPIANSNCVPPTHHIHGISPPPSASVMAGHSPHYTASVPLPHINGYAPIPQSHGLPAHYNPHPSPSRQYSNVSPPAHMHGVTHSPHMAHSARSATGPPPSGRPNESVYSLPGQPRPPFGIHQGSPPLLNRPSTPRDSMPDQSNTRPSSSGTNPRFSGGASASPSLRNLLS
ncbi:MAG: hypothetical protein M1819_002831 [Sarea resinae]|nr:MAG: hypothetical protein M1819_002831 [Sarea resinae]